MLLLLSLLNVLIVVGYLDLSCHLSYPPFLFVVNPRWDPCSHCDQILLACWFLLARKCFRIRVRCWRAARFGRCRNSSHCDGYCLPSSTIINHQLVQQLHPHPMRVSAALQRIRQCNNRPRRPVVWRHCAPQRRTRTVAKIRWQYGRFRQVAVH